MPVVLAGLLLLLCLGCSGDRGDGEQFRIFHLEAAIGEPDLAGELYCGPPRTVCPGVVRQPPRDDSWYAVRADAVITSEDIVRSTVRRGTDREAETAVVLVDLTGDGREAFARLTREVARVGARDQGWHHVAIVVGDEIVAFPEVDYDQYPDGFADVPAIQIAAVSEADADDLVARLRGA